MLHKYKTDSNRTWQVMKEIIGKQKTKSNLIPQEIKADRTIIQNPQDIAEEFNKFLTPHNEKMQFEEWNFDEFEEVFKSLKRNKAAGFNDLSSSIIIDVCDSFKNILFHVFKVSIQQ